MCVRILPACLFVHYMSARYIRSSERVLDPLNLEFQTVVSCHGGTGKRLWSSAAGLSCIISTPADCF